MDFGKIRWDKEDPGIKGKEEILLSLKGKSWADGSTPDFRLTNDSTT
jgi:hypothetical protein